MNDANRFHHLPFLEVIAGQDVDQLMAKDQQYGASWKQRGGVGAFMMLARKWDRLENMVREAKIYTVPVPTPADEPIQRVEQKMASGYDIFDHVTLQAQEHGDAETLIDTIGDLRRYLLLVEAEVMARSGAPTPPELSGHVSLEAIPNTAHAQEMAHALLPEERAAQ